MTRQKSDSITHLVKIVAEEVFNEKTDIELTARMMATGGTAAAIAGGFDIVLVAQ